MTQVTWILLLSVIRVPTHGLAGLPEEGKQSEGREQSARTGLEEGIQSLEKDSELLRRKKKSPGIQSLPRAIKPFTWALLAPVPRKP